MEPTANGSHENKNHTLPRLGYVSTERPAGEERPRGRVPTGREAGLFTPGLLTAGPPETWAEGVSRVKRGRTEVQVRAEAPA